MSDDPGVAVVGGGPAGLASAVALARHGVPATVFEAGDAIGHAWRSRYDRLRLNTSRITSRVLGRSYGDGAPLFPARDEFVSYLERLAATEGVHVRLRTRVHRLSHDDGGWALETSGGEVCAPEVIVATGYANLPFLPHWPGRGDFTRPIIHSAGYRNASAFADQDVLVVGAGSSGMEIAHDLADGGARRVRLAIRTPPNIVLRSVGGMPGDLVGVALMRLPPRLADALDRSARRVLLGNLGAHGLPYPSERTFARLRRLGVGPAVVDRATLDAVKAGRIEVVAGVDSLGRAHVELADGSRIEPDAVIAATGYGCGLVPLAGHLGVLDPRGVPRVTGGREAVPGLRFVGFEPVPGQIRRISVEAKRAAREIAREHSEVRAPRRQSVTPLTHP